MSSVCSWFVVPPQPLRDPHAWRGEPAGGRTVRAVAVDETSEPGSIELAHEIRLALAMNGGVSLAVWIGGVTLELYRASKADEPSIYAELLALSRSRLVIDVVAGASAGGLNGGLLAAAWSRDLPSQVFAGLGDVWLDTGSFSDLVRNPFDSDPPSLLKGDEYFLPQLEHVLERWIVGKIPRAIHPDRPEPFDVALTVTTLDPQVLPQRDDLGNEWVETEYRAQLRFDADRLLHSDPRRLSRQIALAARTSASFPGAFEPSFVPIGADDAVAPDMAGIATFGESMWAMDGGVLVNRPVGPALELIAQHRYVDQGRRVLCYIDPAPGNDAAPPAAKRDDMPVLADVVAKALVELPRNETLTDELGRIKATSDAVVLQRNTRSSLLLGVSSARLDAAGERRRGSTEPPLERLARDLYPLWVRAQSRDAAERAIRAHVRASGRRLDDVVPAFERHAGGEPYSWTDLLADIVSARAARAWLAGSFPAATSTGRARRELDRSSPPLDRAERWSYGIDAIEYLCSTVNELVDRALRAMRVTVPAELAPSVQQLLVLRRQVRRTRYTVALVRQADDAYWQAALAALPRVRVEQLGAALLDAWPWPPGVEPASVPADDRGDIWSNLLAAIAPFEEEGEPARLAVERALWAAVRTLVEALVEARPGLSAAAGAAEGGVLDRLVERILGPAGQPDEVPVVLHRLLALFVVHSLIEDVRAVEAPIDFVQISSAAPTPLDPARPGVRKLAGLQLGHFGAFLKTSWRANDWMWGRLDAAVQLVGILLDPDQLRRAVGPEAAVTAALADLWRSRGEPVPPDLAQLVAAHLDAPASASRADRTLVGEVARLAQVEIARRELPRVAAAITRSGAEGAATSAAAARFAIDAGRDLSAATADDVARLLASCPVGAESVTDELGSSQSLEVTTAVAAVGAAALGGSRSGVTPLRFLRGSVRSAALAVHLVVGGLGRRERGTAVLANAALVVGLGLLAVRAAGGSVPAGGFPIALIGLVVWTLLSTLRAGRLRTALPLLAFGVTLVATSIDESTATTLFDPSDGHMWKVAVRAGGAIVLVLAGVAAVLGRRSGAARATRAVALAVAAGAWWAAATWLLVDQDHRSWAGAFRWLNDWQAVVLVVVVPVVATLLLRAWARGRAVFSRGS